MNELDYIDLRKNKQKRKLKYIIISIIMIFSVIAGICVIYVSDYYKADYKAIEVFSSLEDVSKEPLDKTLVFKPDEATTGFIFYPGGKVEYSAYEPLMVECAKQGIMCVLVEMPFNLAVLDINAANGIQERFPEIKDWYIGGHSLGGSMAASYVADHTNDYKGLILLGSYSTADLSTTKLDVLSIYGSEDKVMNFDKYIENKDNLPLDFNEVIIEGGCHAYFGMYGVQDGDGKPTITNEQQIILTANHIAKMMNNQ